MKILGLSCSPRRAGNTEILVSESLKGAESEGGTVELYSLAGKDIRPCDGCGACRTTGKCHIKDDVQEIYPKLVEADGIIFGSPVYFHAMTGQAKCLFDRTLFLRYPEIQLAGKVGAAIVVAGRLGIIDVLKAFYFFCAHNHMVPADYIIGYPVGDKGAVKQDEMVMKQAWELGREMVAMTKNDYTFPEEFNRGLQSLVMEKYNLSL